MRLFSTISIIIFLFAASVSVNAVYAQTFKFQLANPATPSAKVGDNFDVQVLINTAGKQTLGGDAIVIFDNNILGIKSVQKGIFYEVFQDHTLGSSITKYLLSAWQTTEVKPVSSSTDTLFGKVTFNAKAVGNTTLSFDCTSGSTDSNIWDTAQTDIIKCADLKPLVVNIGASGPTSTPSATMTPGPTSTPVPTVTPRPTSTIAPSNTPRPTVSELPRSGAAEVTIGALGIGAILTVVGLLVIL